MPDAIVLEAAEHALEKRLSHVDERLRTVDTKLVALLTLTSILSAVVTGGLAAALGMKIDERFPLVPVWISLALIVYLGVNLLRSLWAAVSGLMRRSYRDIAYEDIMPAVNEDHIAYRARLLNQHLSNARWNDWVLDQKVSELAVAHVALRNALSATGGLIVIALVIALLRLP
jgi:hypothetical protein